MRVFRRECPCPIHISRQTERSDTETETRSEPRLLQDSVECLELAAGDVEVW